MTPVEIMDVAKSCFKRKAEKEKEQWRRTRWMTTWIVNMSMKSVKKDIKPEDLLKFEDKIEIIDAEERKKEAMETLKRSGLKVFDKEDYKRLMKTSKEN